VEGQNLSMLEEFLDVLGGDEFEEKPVELEEFVTSNNYLNLPPLSDYQYQSIRAMTQIYKKKTLISLYGERRGEERWRQTCDEIILQLGKGSGKDYMSTIAVVYMVYLLLCLKAPALYYGKPPGDAIDIINIAINADQARNVFFGGLKLKIENSPWFVGRYRVTAQSIVFDKNITCHSGHSERESWEGYNVICVILDEISGFSMDSTSGNDQSKTAGSIYDMYRASVDSRFPDFGKVILLSFPRYKNDFIQQKYNAVIADKTVEVKYHKFKIDPEREDGIPENEFFVEWEDDVINSYKLPRVFALKKPTWEVNPTRKIEDFTKAFYTNPLDALSRFACMPPDAVDAFFRSRQKIETCFNRPVLAIEQTGRFADWFIPDDNKEYFIHVDLAQKHDHCAVAISHVDRWVKLKNFNDYSIAVPYVVVDAVRWWTPTAEKTVDFKEVKEFILDIKRRGFSVKMVTFDRWNSFDIMNELKMSGMNAETLSVAKKHYEDMAMLISEERVSGPQIPLLIDELLQLRIIRDKVDHPRKGSKDLADAVCGSIYNSISLSRKNIGSPEIEVHTYSDFKDDNKIYEGDNVIRAPKKRSEMPEDIENYLERMRAL